ncbi:MAG: acetyltransferase [Oscillochloris sp.]|nr:acetyltransferase [Oscillochloris sp.]
MTDEETVRLELARAVRDACLGAALAECEIARMDGLCWAGAWEAAIGAMRALDLERIVHGVGASERLPSEGHQ